MFPKIYILLPVHNRCEVTRRFLECLAKQTYTDYELIMIDDGSTDDTVQTACTVIPSTHVLRGDGTLWWAGALQKGYDYLCSIVKNDHDIVLIANDDVEFRVDFLENAVNYLAHRPLGLLLAQCFSMQTGKLLDSGVHVNWNQFTFRQAVAPDEINCLSTRGLFLHVDFFLELGGFYPRVLPHYFSDYEFTIRAYKRGAALSVTPSVCVCLNERTTGEHRFSRDSLSEYLSWVFSIKNPNNPIYSTVFIFLAAPYRWKLKNLIVVWSVFLKGTLEMTLHGFKRHFK